MDKKFLLTLGFVAALVWVDGPANAKLGPKALCKHSKDCQSQICKGYCYPTADTPKITPEECQQPPNLFRFGRCAPK